jgi:hypothetical protein
VLKDFVKTIVVFEDKEVYQDAVKDSYHDVLIYHIHQPELIRKLEDYQIISYDLESVVQTKRYERIKKYYLSRVLGDTEHPIKDILDNKALFRSYLNKLNVQDRKKVMGVELYLERIARSNAYKLEDMVEQELFFGLMDPHSSLSPNDRDIIHKLLINIAPS